MERPGIISRIFRSAHDRVDEIYVGDNLDVELHLSRVTFARIKFYPFSLELYLLLLDVLALGLSPSLPNTFGFTGALFLLLFLFACEGKRLYHIVR